eukprot:Gb_36122 [translate_table: standard]
MPTLYTFTTAASSASAKHVTLEQLHRKTEIPTLDIKESRQPSKPNQFIASSLLTPVSQACSKPIKPKRIDAPLHEALRARLCGNWVDEERMTTHYTSSGSDHQVESLGLADMINGFIEGDEKESALTCCDRSRSNCLVNDGKVVCGGRDGEDSGCQESMPFLGEQLCEILEGLSCCTSTLELRLLREAAKSLEMAKENAGFFIENEDHNGWFRRFVMSDLRSAGYNAAICKSRGEQSTSGFPAGDYEFIDVIMEGRRSKNERFFVDINFRAQFEIARPTSQYSALVQVLPKLFVGKAERLRQIIMITCDAAKRSLKSKGMYLPPWRKYRYTQAKWLGPYKRTINPGTSLQHGTNMPFLRELVGIALKGEAWDPGFPFPLELLLEKPIRESKKTLLQESEVRLQWDSERISRSKLGFAKENLELENHPAHPPSTSPGIRSGEPLRSGKVSGLASALAEAGITSISPSQHLPAKGRRGDFIGLVPTCHVSNQRLRKGDESPRSTVVNLQANLDFRKEWLEDPNREIISETWSCLIEDV